ncbi:675_t:CDS:2 [Ambispora gerdemannii]|uniref:675_t:CDS:1 n=1 Tax=Ambispora gerdemannii TaxID=144530 RepID=A0A9N9CQE1_9GLOM|nr:675_t:CDS:2 [Ambispora gerdemannii]
MASRRRTTEKKSRGRLIHVSDFITDIIATISHEAHVMIDSEKIMMDVFAFDSIYQLP